MIRSNLKKLCTIIVYKKKCFQTLLKNRLRAFDTVNPLRLRSNGVQSAEATNIWLGATEKNY